MAKPETHPEAPRQREVHAPPRPPAGGRFQATDPLGGDPTPAAPTPPPGGDWRAGVATASGLNALAGIWLIIAPFVLGYRNGDPYWNDIILGVIVCVLAMLSAGAGEDAAYAERAWYRR